MADPGEDASRVYQYEELMEQKRRANLAKKKIESVPIKDWDMSSRALNEYEYLRKEALKPYDAQFVSNAWLKMWELAGEFLPTLIDNSFTKTRTIVKAGSRTNSEVKQKVSELNIAKILYSFHVAEAPGSFLLAINHWLYSTYPNLEWKWIAESYRDVAEKDSQYLGDRYGIMRKYDENWFYGAEGNGDITSPDNLRSFQHHLPKCQLVTSDVKSPVSDYDEEEAQLYAVHVGHILAAMGTLAKGGMTILKTFSYYEARSVNLLFLLTQYFEKVYITKPVTSRPANSETYIVCEGFLGVTDVIMDKLLAHLAEKDMPGKCLYKIIDVPGALVDRIVEINEALLAQQETEIDRILAGIKDKQGAKAVEAIQRKSAADFLAKYPIKKLPAERKL